MGRFDLGIRVERQEVQRSALYDKTSQAIGCRDVPHLEDLGYLWVTMICRLKAILT